MSYKENPKTKGSGILGAIPQTGFCPNGCEDCFFQSGRSYLEPLADNLPNLPSILDAENRIVRVNDGNDSNVMRDVVLAETAHYKQRFFNTAIPEDLESFPGPVVLTINPGNKTDESFTALKEIPKNLMFVRFRVNAWNFSPMGEAAVQHYSKLDCPIVMTFMAYHNPESIPWAYTESYELRKRTLNEYYAITQAAWADIMLRWQTNKWVYSCGREGLATGCRWCGNCLREYYATLERLRA